MAKLKENEKDQLLADWKTGQYSQNDLMKKYNVSKGTVNKLCKGVEQTNKEIVTAQTRINIEMSKKNDQEVTAINEAVMIQTRRANLVYGATEKLLRKIDTAIEHGKTYEKVNSGDGIQRLEPVEYGSSDFKNFADAIDKASLTLGVNQRHSNATTTINNNNTNATQVNTKTLEDFYEDIN